MKKICLLLTFLLLLTGCSKSEPVPAAQTQENVWVSMDIYAINDLHGKLADTAAQPGLDELSTYLKQGQNTILLSTGDMWQGTSESHSTKGFIITEWMNEMGFAAMTLGGHEFDWGQDLVRQNLQLAQFPFLGINVYSRLTDQQVDYCQSSVVVEIEGVQIGIIGAIGDCSASVSSENIQDIYFKTGPELTELVKQEAEKLRSQGVDFVVYSIHDGSAMTTSDTQPVAVSDGELAAYYDVALSAGYVDLVFEADTHYWYMLTDSQGVCHLQAGGNNNGISHARVLVNRKTGESSVVTTELVSASKYSFLDDDPVVETLLEKYAQKIAPTTKVLGSNGQYRNKAAICQLVADLYCAAGVEKWGEEYDIVLGGGYISCRSPGYLNAGEVTYSQLQSLLPFDNQITLCSIQGADLLSKFLQTTNNNYYIKTTAYGEKIRNAIDPNATYYVVTDSYSANYAYNRMTVIDTFHPGVFARDLVADHIAAGGWA